jgi:hypothetical protein
MGGESGKRSRERRRHSWRAMSRRRERAPGSQPPDGAKADGRGFGVGSKPAPFETAAEKTRLLQGERVPSHCHVNLESVC